MSCLLTKSFLLLYFSLSLTYLSKTTSTPARLHYIFTFMFLLNFITQTKNTSYFFSLRARFFFLSDVIKMEQMKI